MTKDDLNKNLLHAAEIGDANELNKCLLFGADVNFRNRHNHMTPLLYAASYQHINLVDILIRHPKIDVNAKDIKSWTPAMIAIEFNDFTLFCAILHHPDADAVISHPTLGSISLKALRGNQELKILFEMFRSFLAESFRQNI